MTPALIAFALGLVLAPFVIVALTRRGVLDFPNERSSHERPIPRGGGIAPAAAAGVALVVASERLGTVWSAVVVAIAVFGLIGLLEDVKGVPALPRLGLQAAAAAVVVPIAVDAPSGSLLWRASVIALALLFVVAYVNAFNFMDGINGISVAQVVVAGAAWYVAGHAGGVPAFAVAGGVLAAAALAFAPFNFPSARVFLGDVGSYAFGGALAVMCLIGLRAGLPPEAVVAPVSLYLADTGATLARRVVRGETWYRPHRDHAYQKLVRLGWSHTRTTIFATALMVAVSALGTVSLLDVATPIRAAAGAAIAALLTAYLSAPAVIRRTSPEPLPA